MPSMSTPETLFSGSSTSAQRAVPSIPKYSFFFICRSSVVSVQCLKYSVAEILSKYPCCNTLERSDSGFGGMEVPLPNWPAGIFTPKPVLSWQSHSSTHSCLTALLSLARALSWQHNVIRPKPTNKQQGCHQDLSSRGLGFLPSWFPCI